MLISSSIASSLRCFKTTFLIFLKCLTWHVFWRDWEEIRILVPPVWTPRVDAGLEILWAEKFTYGVWLFCIRPLLHLHTVPAKASGRWAEGHPSQSVTAPPLLPCPLLPWLSVHSPRAHVGPQLLKLRKTLTSGLSSFVHTVLSLDGLSRTGISYNSEICSILKDTQWCALKKTVAFRCAVWQPFPIAWP